MRGKVLQTRVRAVWPSGEVVHGEGDEQEARASARGGCTPRQQLGRNPPLYRSLLTYLYAVGHVQVNLNSLK